MATDYPFNVLLNLGHSAYPILNIPCEASDAHEFQQPSADISQKRVKLRQILFRLNMVQVELTNQSVQYTLAEFRLDYV